VTRPAAAAAALLACLAAAPGEHVDRLDGERVAGQVRSVTAEAVVVAAGQGLRTVARRDAAEVFLAAATDLMSARGQDVLVAADGEAIGISTSGLTIEGDTLRFPTHLLGPVRLPLSAARTIYRPDDKTAAADVRERCEQLQLDDAPGDVLVLEREKGAWMTVSGVLKGIGGGKVGFEWRGRKGEIEMAQVRAIRFAPTSRPAAAVVAKVVGRDGSTVSATKLTLDAEAASVEIPGVGPRRIPRSRLARVRFVSSRVVWLSELEPASAREHGVFETFGHRADRSAGGGPIRLGGQAYDTGLGLHSFCELTYELGGAYSTFVAIAGIDDAVRPRGEAELTILADGKALAGPIKLTGKDKKPTPLRLDVAGAHKLTIRVGFGPHGLDNADHVDLALARLIK
jgi:hypothetical protein